MKKRIVLITMLCCSWAVYAQFDAQSAYYMFLQSTYNPASAGKGTQLEASGAYRAQWVGITNAPRTAYFQAQSPFVLGNTEHGAGIRFMNDKIGLFVNQAAYAQYAYKYKLGKGHLSAGVDLGFISLTFKGDSVHKVTSDYHDLLGDVAIPQTKQSATKFDMGFGVYYHAEKWYAGVSYSHLTTPLLKLGDLSDFSIHGTLYAVGGYNWTLKNKNFAIKPSALLKSDFRTWSFDVSALLEYKARFRGGLNFRYGDAVGVLLGGDIINGLSLAYAYELPINKLLQASSGSHEVYFAYGFDILRQKRTSKYKSIRIL